VCGDTALIRLLTLPVQVVFDTGSSSLEFASTYRIFPYHFLNPQIDGTGTLCASCNQVKFDSSKSSTFVDGGRTTSITFGTGVGVDPVVGDNYSLTLRSAKDVVTVGGLVAKATNLFLITDQTPKFNIDPFSGIQGMGAQAQGFFASLISQGLPCKLSIQKKETLF